MLSSRLITSIIRIQHRHDAARRCMRMGQICMTLTRLSQLVLRVFDPLHETRRVSITVTVICKPFPTRASGTYQLEEENATHSARIF